MQVEQSSMGKFKILVVSLSEIWARSAKTILATLQDIELLNTARGGLTAYEVARTECPHLMVVDDSLPSDEVLRLLELLTDLPHRPYCIAMVPSLRHKWLVLKAGADATVLRTSTSHDLISAVKTARDQIQAGH